MSLYVRLCTKKKTKETKTKKYCNRGEKLFKRFVVNNKKKKKKIKRKTLKENQAYTHIYIHMHKFIQQCKAMFALK